MNSADGISASVYTRWHQLAVPFAFGLSAGSFVLVIFNRGSLGIAGVVALLALLVPLLITFKVFPTRNLIKITPDGLEFSRRAPIAFSDLTRWGDDDLLKLVRSGYPTLLVSPLDLPNRKILFSQFRNALEDWQKKQHPGKKPVQRTHFYGSTGARLIGALIATLGGVSAMMAMNLREPSIALAIVATLGALFGLAMLFGKRV
ncbi:hypothetical protein F3W84_13805 [Ochrobactrum quorumnocens]|uniref:PH domain-containing protein n=2 Tax=Ochrobactrum quorumnocens TaxID=271865 RepID=A0A5N1JTK9_9HYPH|nr:hypothetical protein F3W84_13805 [[Ochrobactrum] quorumnocens]